MERELPTLTIDPGHNGAGVLMLGREVLALTHWDRHRSGGRWVYRLRVHVTGQETWERDGITSTYMVGVHIHRRIQKAVLMRGGGRAHVICEGSHIGRNPMGSISQTRLTGMLMGPLSVFARDNEIIWIQPGEWWTGLFRPKWWGLQASEAGRFNSKKKAREHLNGLYTVRQAGGMPEDETQAKMEREERKLFMTKREAAKSEAMRIALIEMPTLTRFKVQGFDIEHICDAVCMSLHFIEKKNGGKDGNR